MPHSSDLRSYSRCVDLLPTSRSPLGSSLELTDYGTWLRQRAAAAAGHAAVDYDPDATG